MAVAVARERRAERRSLEMMAIFAGLVWLRICAGGLTTNEL